MNVTSMKSVIRSFGPAALVTATAAVTLAALTPALTPAYASTGSVYVACMSVGDIAGIGVTYSPTILWPPNQPAGSRNCCALADRAPVKSDTPSRNSSAHYCSGSGSPSLAAVLLMVLGSTPSPFAN